MPLFIRGHRRDSPYTFVCFLTTLPRRPTRIRSWNVALALHGNAVSAEIARHAALALQREREDALFRQEPKPKDSRLVTFPSGGHVG
jgi:hypothetical protein